MNAFVEKSTGKVLTTSERPAEFGGPWGALQSAGQAVWLPVPDGEVIEDCDVSGTAVVLNPTKKADRVAKAAARAERKARLASADAMAAGLPELKVIVQHILAQLRGD